MTISTALRKAGPFTGNGATTAFPFSFKVFAATDATVTVANTQGNESVLALGADYAVALNADQDAAPGGTVTLAAPLSTGYRLVVSSAVPNLQPTDITNNGGFYPRVIEDALDRHVAQIQQIDEKVDRALKVAVTSPLGDQALPSPVAGMLIGWNESNDGLKNYAPIGGTLLGQQLAAAYGSSLVGFQQAGTGAVVRTAQDKMREVVSVSDFGATGDGITDDTAAILAAITYAKTLSSPKLVVGAGVFKTSGTLLFDMPNGSHIEFVGTIVSNVTATSAVIIGSETGNLRGYHVTGIKVQRTTNDTAGGSIGVQIRNLVSSFIDVREVMGFQDGVFLFGTQANGGVSYNEIHLGLIHDNKRNVYLSASGAGYCNENTVFCGSLNHSSSYPAVATVNLEIAHFATAVLNNNRFFCPSFEDNSALAVAASINGDNNIIFHPRLENPAIQSTYPIRFETNARACALIGSGFSIIQTNIVDLGAETCVQTRSGMRYMAQTTAGAGNAVFAGRSIATSAARIFVTEDTSGNATSFGTGAGDWTVHSLLSNSGVLGYTAGAGGAVTQLTSKGTAVSLNAPSGQITMHNASLAAGAKIEFLFNNTFITQQSLLVLSLQNSGAGLNYRVDVASTSPGNCAIRLTNLSGGALAEAVTINFAVINSSLS